LRVGELANERERCRERAAELTASPAVNAAVVLEHVPEGFGSAENGLRPGDVDLPGGTHGGDDLGATVRRKVVERIHGMSVGGTSCHSVVVVLVVLELVVLLLTSPLLASLARSIVPLAATAGVAVPGSLRAVGEKGVGGALGRRSSYEV